MDVVVRFALQQLRFPPQKIIIYAWSIGGFTATWAAMSYPDLGGLVLDASFDDLVPLALKVLPRSWRESLTPPNPPDPP
ncbi:protein ABHD16B-like [Neopelma chrysocephalum]|uniref:protein ABHD16B-like n=1 Tax=Neopelma chrysocephalum TaxID=114329 RepID=UPI000FCCFD19|nr:protein ABHD16B-like [Neopelma chrysocephalum]